MKYLYFSIMLLLFNIGIIEGQTEFETHVRIQSTNIGFYNSSNDGNFMFTDGEGDFQLVGGKILEYKRNGDLIKHSGGELQLNSSNDSKHFAFNVDNDNILNISRTDATSAIYIDGDDQYIGINSALPLTELHVKQKRTPFYSGGVFTFVSDLAGLNIEDDDGTDWTLFIDNADDFSFALNTLHKCYIRATDGRYVSPAGQAPAIRQEKSNLHITDRISKLNMSYNSGKDKSKYKSGINVDVNQLEALFPEAVDVKSEGKGIIYSEFGLIALRAIQEQQEIIHALVERIEKLEKG